MITCKCGSTKVRYTKRIGPARNGAKFIKNSEGKPQLAPCNGEVIRLCRKCQAKEGY